MANCFLKNYEVTKMILADKIIKHRKLNGWSQEELAERTGVSRQAVSKWESAQSVPDLDKILKLSSLFGVTTDYLLKDSLETEDFINDSEQSAIRKITMEEANKYLSLRKKHRCKLHLLHLCVYYRLYVCSYSVQSRKCRIRVFRKTWQV